MTNSNLTVSTISTNTAFQLLDVVSSSTTAPMIDMIKENLNRAAECVAEDHAAELDMFRAVNVKTTEVAKAGMVELAEVNAAELEAKDAEIAALQMTIRMMESEAKKAADTRPASAANWNSVLMQNT